MRSLLIVVAALVLDVGYGKLGVSVPGGTAGVRTHGLSGSFGGNSISWTTGGPAGTSGAGLGGTTGGCRSIVCWAWSYKSWRCAEWYSRWWPGWCHGQ
ncbi:hypothetical protein MTO96_046572 [Rhipicephalus appendiculatus]